MNKRLLRPAQFPERWAVVNLSPCDMSVVGRFVEGLQEAMKNRGEYFITKKAIWMVDHFYPEFLGMSKYLDDWQNQCFLTLPRHL